MVEKRSNLSLEVRKRLGDEAWDLAMASRIHSTIRFRRQITAAWVGGLVFSLVLATPLLVPEWRWDLGNLLSGGQNNTRIALEISAGYLGEE